MSDTQQGQGVEARDAVSEFWMNMALQLKDELVKRGDTIDDLTATVARLTQELAEAQQWEPLPDRLYQFDKVQGIALTEDGAMLEAIICRDPRWTDTVGIELPKHVRLCQRRTNTPQEGE